MAENGEVFHNVPLTLPSKVKPPASDEVYDGPVAPSSRKFKAQEIQRYQYLFKLIIIGDQSVGKTNLTMRFCEFDFSPNYVATIGIDFKVKTVEIGGKRVKLQIWDTAGQERFQSISKMYYRGAHGVMYVYDVTHRPSFQNVQKWVSTYENASGDVNNDNSDIPKVLIGNKCDHEELRQVRPEEGDAAAQLFRLTFFETSAKTGYNVEEAFMHVARQILIKKDKGTSASETRFQSKMKKKRQSKRGWSWSSACSLL